MFFNFKNVLIRTYRDGTLYIKKHLLLNDGGAVVKGIVEHDVQQQRKVGMHQLSDPEKLAQKPWLMRRETACLAEGTIFGTAQKFIDAGRHQSIFGINRECVDENGFPNASQVTKYLRETAPSVDIKEQRINLYENVILAGDFYDNATSLLMVFLMKIQKYRMIQKTATYKHTVRLAWHELVEMVKMQSIEQRFERLLQMIRSGTTGCGTSKNDLTNWDLLTRVENWVASEQRAGRKDGFFPFETTVWKCYTYDDGHSKSGAHFGDHFDFVNGMYMVPQDAFLAEQVGEPIAMCVKSEIPGTDSGIKNLQRYNHWINCTSLSEDEVVILQHVLEGNKRNTPFLIDQEVDFGLGPQSVALVSGYTSYGGSYRYDDKQLIRLMHKLVSVHRWHEDAINASRLLLPWFSMPATETVESHWWTYVKRCLRYPTLGLKRAAIPCLMLGDAVCTSADAIQDYEELICGNDSLVLNSLMYNTYWQWAEYMLVMNTVDTHEMLKNIDFNVRDDINPMVRANQLVSAISGQEVPVCSYEHCYTYIEGGLDNYKKIRVPFGKVKIMNPDEYGYEDHPNFVLFKQLVAPGATALVTGLAGSLLDGTPLHSTFTINPAVYKRGRGQYQKALNYSDLWCVGLVNRWNGYNTWYKHPTQGGRHTMYCANNVNIACPPVSPGTLPFAMSYDVLNAEERERSWGRDFMDRLDSEQTFFWTTGRMEVMSEPTWNAEIAFTENLRMNIPKYYTQSSDLVADTLARLSTKFDLYSAGFHVTRVNVGSTFQKNIGTSRSEPVIPPETGQHDETQIPPSSVDQT